MNEHLLNCARKQYIQEARQHMKDQFNYIHCCAWNDCNSSFQGKSCGVNSLHVTRHLREIRTHQCLWDACDQTFNNHEELAFHVSDKHRVPKETRLGVSAGPTNPAVACRDCRELHPLGIPLPSSRKLTNPTPLRLATATYSIIVSAIPP
jgi:hypothetical protein